jgi:hypothetical protein
MLRIVPLIFIASALLGCTSEPVHAPAQGNGVVVPNRPDSVPEEWGTVELSAAIAACFPEELEYRAALRRRLLDLQPDDAALKLQLGRDLAQIGHTELAESLLQEASTDPACLIPATLALAGLFEQDQRFLVAASLLEQLSAQADVAQRRSLLERASRLRQKGGDLPMALADLELALQGISISEAEQRLLDQMKAFQNGEFSHAHDAVKVFHNHENLQLRLKAGHYLAAQADTAPAIFADALGDPHPQILLLSVAELVDRSNGLNGAAIFPLLDHEHPEVRIAATSALGSMKVGGAAPLILARLEPNDRELFRAQNMALERLCGQSIAPDLDPNDERRAQIAELWLEWWNQHG